MVCAATGSTGSSFVYDRSTRSRRALGTLGGKFGTTPVDIDHGIVVGTGHTASEQEHAFAYDVATGTIRDLGTLGGATSSAVAVSDGVVVGTSLTAAGFEHAFAYDLAAGTMRDLGTLGGTGSYATDVDAGVVVGRSFTADPTAGNHTFVYDLRATVPGMRDLGDGFPTAVDDRRRGRQLHDRGRPAARLGLRSGRRHPRPQGPGHPGRGDLERQRRGRRRGGRVVPDRRARHPRLRLRPSGGQPADAGPRRPDRRHQQRLLDQRTLHRRHGLPRRRPPAPRLRLRPRRHPPDGRPGPGGSNDKPGIVVDGNVAVGTSYLTVSGTGIDQQRDGRATAWTLRTTTAPAFTFGTTQYSTRERATRVKVTVVRAGNRNRAVSVHYATRGLTAVAGKDFRSTSGTLRFAPGQVRKAFYVKVLNDRRKEKAETIQLTLRSPSTGTILGAPNAAALTIRAND